MFSHNDIEAVKKFVMINFPSQDWTVFKMETT
jgi:hypothetical protein